MRIITSVCVLSVLFLLTGCVPPQQPGDQTVCTMEYDPVCGEDGKTYGNDCVANNAGVEIAYEGECEENENQEEDNNPQDNEQSEGQQPTSTSNVENLSLLSVPEGFNIEVYGEVDEARSLEVVEEEERTVVFIGNRNDSNVYAIIDNNGDYKADRTVTIASGLNSPNGVAYRDGDLYVAEIDRILLFQDILDNLDNAEYEVWYDNLPSDGHHGWKYIAFGPDGNLYVPIGAPCNVCDAGEPYAAIWKIDFETKERTLVAEGVRNTVGFDWNPDTGQFWFTDNGRDRMGDNRPGDELNTVTEMGQDFGYPHCHQGDIQDPEFDQSCDQFKAPEVVLGPHVAALGMEFYDRDAYEHPFPEQYDGKIFIAEHGSWNRTVPIGYRIMLVDPQEQTYDPFITGWLQGSSDWGRPVDIEFLNDGSMLISDDSTGYVYRVWYTQ